MKTGPAIALLAALAFLLATCGSGWKSGPITVTGPTTTTITKVKAGTLIRCTGGPGAKVPPLDGAVAASSTSIAEGKKPALAGSLKVTHRRDGSIVVSCARGRGSGG